MTCVSEYTIKHHMKSRSLVSLTRDEFEVNNHQGFIIDYDSKWIVLQHIHDFYLNGFVILRRSDLTSISSKETDQFHKSLLKADGILKKVNFQFQLPIGGLADLLANLPEERIVILEDETKEDFFLIGPILGVQNDIVSLRFFSGSGEWDNEPAEIAIDDITSASFSTNYTLAYERHFQRQSSPTKD